MKGVNKDPETFQVASLQQAEALGTNISRYGEVAFGQYDVLDHIRNIYNYSRSHSESDRINGKLLNAYIDLELTYLFMMKDSDLAAGTHNRLQDTGKLTSRSVFGDFELFSGKMDILYSLSALSFRIRAFWDKYMGVLFLLYEHQKYEKYIGARSRKSFFTRNAQKWPEISLHLRRCLTNIVRTWLIHSGQHEAVRKIDSSGIVVPFPEPFLDIVSDFIAMVDEIRTPEAHGSGFLRKWTLANFPLDRSRDFALMNHLNIANEFMHALRCTIKEYSDQSVASSR